MAGKWFEKRTAFRQTVGMRVTEVIEDNAISFAASQRQLVIDAMRKTLEKYAERLDNGEIKPTTKDAVAAAAALRAYLADTVAAAPSEEAPLDPTTVELPPDALAAFVTAFNRGEIRVLPSGEEPADDATLSDAGA